MQRLHIFVVDNDGDMIGSLLTGVTATIQSLNIDYTPNLIQKDISSFDEISQQVLNGEAWAAIVANSGATDRYINTLLN